MAQAASDERLDALASALASSPEEQSNML